MSTCAHGLPASQCLICATLGTSDKTKTAERPSDVLYSAGPAQVIQTSTSGARPRLRRRVAPRLVGGLLLIVIVALLGWWILGLVWAVVRLLELVAVGLVGAYAGYHVGKVSGRHEEREKLKRQ